jgi:beta-fructofuranosidase
MLADGPLGPFRFSTDEFMVGDGAWPFYSGKLVQAPGGGTTVFLAYRHLASDGTFVGELCDPVPLIVDEAGNLSVAPHGQPKNL